MSPHTWRRQSPRKPSSCTIITLNSHWGRAATGKKCLASMRAGSLQWWPTLCNPVDCGRPGFSVREGVLQARILEPIGQDCLPYPSRALYFLLPEPPTPLSTWCCQNPCNPRSCTTSTPGPHCGRCKSSRAASGANPSGRPTAEVEIKPQLKPRGSVTEEEDPNLSTSCTSCRLNPHTQLVESVSMQYIKGH